VLPGISQLAPHLPAHPQQQQATTDQKCATQRKKPCRRQCENDAQDGGRNDAHKDGLAPLLLGQACSCEANDNGIVACKHKVDHDNLAEGQKGFIGEKKVEQEVTPVLGRASHNAAAHLAQAQV
jgi:hypothetical protein